MKIIVDEEWEILSIKALSFAERFVSAKNLVVVGRSQ